MLEAEAAVHTLLNPSRAALLAAMPGMQAMIGGISVMFDADFFDRCPDLLVLARHGVGLDNVDLAAATERGVFILYTPQAMITAVAEHAVAFMLGLAKSVKRGDVALKEDKYHTRDLLGAVDLHGKTLGVIGCGRIGSRVSLMCAHGLGMNIITYDPYISDEQARLAGAVRKPTLAEVLQAADVVTMHTPLNAETRHMIGSAQLAMMKPTAYLINTSRGPVVDEPSLVAALSAGTIAGAGLDVFEKEPTTPDNPLFAMPNVMCTPHSAGSSLECMQRIATTVAKGILAVFHGERPDAACMANPDVWEQRRPLPWVRRSCLTGARGTHDVCPTARRSPRRTPCLCRKTRDSMPSAGHMLHLVRLKPPLLVCREPHREQTYRDTMSGLHGRHDRWTFSLASMWVQATSRPWPTIRLAGVSLPTPRGRRRNCTRDRNGQSTTHCSSGRT